MRADRHSFPCVYPLSFMYNTPMITKSDIHGHEILALVAQADPPLTLQALQAGVIAHWGADARFCTCSVAGMTLDELLHFLIAHGKIVTRNHLLATDPAKICQH